MAQTDVRNKNSPAFSSWGSIGQTLPAHASSPAYGVTVCAQNDANAQVEKPAAVIGTGENADR